MDKNVWLLRTPQGVLERPERVPATEDQYRDHCSGHISTLAVTLHKYKDKYKYKNTNSAVDFTVESI